MKYFSDVWWNIEKIALAIIALEINMAMGKVIIYCNSTLLALNLMAGQSQYKI